MSYSNLKPSLLAVSANKRRGGRKSTSGFSGVYFHKTSGKWSAMVNLANGTRKHVGLAETPAEAAALRDAFIQTHGVATPKSKAATVSYGGVK
jgi:hypothetical protein